MNKETDGKVMFRNKYLILMVSFLAELGKFLFRFSRTPVLHKLGIYVFLRVSSTSGFTLRGPKVASRKRK